jgi:hypothetical protein
MKRNKITIIALSLVCLTAVFAPPSARCGTGANGGMILGIDTGARPVAMGGSFCAIADDANALQYNPGGIGFITKHEVLLTHNEWIQGVKGNYAGYIQPLGEVWTGAISINYLYVDGLTRRDITGNDLGDDFGANSSVIGLSLARQLGENCGFGGSIKFLQEKLDNKSGTAYCADLGILYDFGVVSAGAALQNFGTKIKLNNTGFNLPSNIKVGLGLKISQCFTVAADVNKPLDSDIDARAGAEYWIANMIAFRAGYKFNTPENTGLGISGGIGIKYENFGIDYSFLPSGDLGNTHRMSHDIKF